MPPARLPHERSSAQARALSPDPGPLIAIVISTEAEIATILRELLTHDGYQVRTEDGSEPLDVVLDRLRPRLVLIDVDHAVAFSAAFIERARGIGAAVVACGPGRPEGEVRALAAVHNVAAFGFPIQLSQFRETLRAALSAS
jgi:CheY-like chemotaxis protein